MYSGVCLFIVVYDRYWNIDLWSYAYRMSGDNIPQYTVVIQNYDAQNMHVCGRIKQICDNNNWIYIKRQNVGYDIGALQDVCTNKLPLVPPWEIAIWVCDDTLPIKKDFISVLLNPIINGTAEFVYTELSTEIRPHIRTTGIAFTRRVAQSIRFNKRIATKLDCYQFEHGDSPFMLYRQLVELDIKLSASSSGLHDAALWDSGHRKHVHTMSEFYNVWKAGNASINARAAIVIVVYNRIYNIFEWIRCYKAAAWDVDMIIIHNLPENQDINLKHDITRLQMLCAIHNIRYVPRKNAGYDIGALKDVAKGIIPDIADAYEWLLWFTDDVLPMNRNMPMCFLSKTTSTTGAVTPYLVNHGGRIHMRTTAFLMRTSVLKRIIFPQHIDKQACYAFEHGDNTIYGQIIDSGYSVDSIHDASAVVWDTDHQMDDCRYMDHYNVFPGGAVTFICPIRNSYPAIIGSLMQQTYSNWRLLLMHDGPMHLNLERIVSQAGDRRIRLVVFDDIAGHWGHARRRWGIENLDSMFPDTQYVVVTNPDNHHVPVYCQRMTEALEDNEQAVASYCSEMIHNYTGWKTIQCRLERGFIDCGCVVARKEAAQRVGWRNMYEHSADWIYISDMVNAYGADKFIRVNGCLFVHN